MELAVGIVVAVVVAVLILTMLGVRKKDRRGSSAAKLARGGAEPEGSRVLKPCPLCGSGLAKGQTLKTKVIEITGSSLRSAPKGVKENRAEVYGCPYCWPASKNHPRTCPSCRQIMSESDVVFARYFERNEGKNHLRILGCSRCRPT